MARIIVLIVGYAQWLEAHKHRACGTATLVRGKYNTIVDTGNVGDAKKIEKLLRKERLAPADIHYVVNTHGDIDHVGCNGLFTRATFISGHDVARNDIFEFFDDTYQIEPDVSVMNTPGHSIEDVSVLVKTKKGLVAITGDLFEKADDTKSQSWKVFSHYPERQIVSRKKILDIANWIIPGHGNMFEVNRSSR